MNRKGGEPFRYGFSLKVLQETGNIMNASKNVYGMGNLFVGQSIESEEFAKHNTPNIILAY